MRSLLSTPRHYEIKKINPGSYYHFGLQFGLDQVIDFIIKYKISNVIYLDFNIDGQPITNSCKKVFKGRNKVFYFQKKIKFCVVFYIRKTILKN